ncbi:unnamed protein product [Pedinophyceae sp. YPF-701]|nr:unnamed protein product [Pedinophyceae sp. YPF-701]
MIVRLRSRDGLERVEVPDDANVRQLRERVEAQLGVPYHEQTLSLSRELLRTGESPAKFKDLSDAALRLTEAGVSNGTVVYLRYDLERQVDASAVRKANPLEASKAFGQSMTVNDLVARQVRVERQEAPKCTGVSFDTQAANAFQSYVSSYLGFSVKRGGVLYGTVDAETGAVTVEAIYEPPQKGTKTTLELERGTPQEAAADAIAAALGLRRVGWVFSQATGVADKDHVLSADEVAQMGAWQAEIGPEAVTAVVSSYSDEEGGAPEVHFEAFQASEQLAKLVADGWVTKAPDDSSLMELRNPQHPDDASPVIVGGKDVGEVDVEWFLMPVPITNHSGALHGSFPVENRITTAHEQDLRNALERKGPFQQRLKDFHLLLWLSDLGHLDKETDLALILEAVRDDKPIMEGYQMMMMGMAGM